MKRNILLLILITVSIAIKAQNLQIVDPNDHNNPIANGTVVTVSGADTLSEILFEAKIKNLGISSINVKVKRKVITSITGAENFLCWFTCYLPSNDVIFAPVEPVPVGPGAFSSEIFSGHISPNGNSGTSTILYTFYNAANPNDSAYFSIKFDVSSTHSVPSIFANANYVSAPYPMPANTFVNFNYCLKSTSRGYAILYNILGEEIKRVELVSTGTAKILTSNLKQGAYICTIVVDDKVIKTNRIIVNH